MYVNIQPSSDLTINQVTGEIPSGTFFRFSVTGITNPLSLEPTESFQVYVVTSRQYDYYVNQATQGLGILNSVPGLLTNV